MSLQIEIAISVPAETARVARAAFAKGTLYMNMRDAFGTFFTDEQFADLFPNRGQPAEAPWRLALVSVMQFAEGLSDRQAADAVRSRIDWKYALGLELTDQGFDYTVLCQFRERLMAGTAELRLLETMLTTFKERGLLKAGGRQRSDSTHVLAAVRVLNRLERVGETLRAALNSLSVVAPDWLKGWVPVEWFDRYGPRMEGYRFPKGDKARQELAGAIGAEGWTLLEAVDAATELPFLAEIPAVKTLRQVWAEQYTDRSTDPQGPAQLRDVKELAPAGDLIASPYDIEARFSVKREISWVGYKAHLTETCDPGMPHLITDVQTTEATSPDENKLPVIQEALSQRNLLPAVHLVDAGYTSGAVVVTSQKRYGVEIIGPVPLDTSWQAQAREGFDKSQFRVDWDAQVVTCPAGKQSVSWWGDTETDEPSASQVRFAKEDCQRCVHRAQCTRAKTAPRQLMLQTREEYEALNAARRRQKTPEFAADYAARAGIEGTQEQAIRRCGLRQARYIGLKKTHLQHILTASALNMVRLGEWIAGAPRAKTRLSRFARLAPAR